MTGTDDFVHEREDVEDIHADRFVTVVTSDTVELAHYCRAIYVGGAGDVKVTGIYGDVTTFKAVPVGTTIEVRAKLIWATGTTATNLVALW
jgi:hypothetical protein